MWSHKTRYALRAMITLAEHDGKPSPVREIAAAREIPQKYLETILGELRGAGLVVSTKGPRGGYALARRSDLITIAEVIAAVDGEVLAALRATAAPGRSGSVSETESPVLRELSAPLFRRLETVTLAEAVQRSHLSRQVTDYVI